MNTIKPTISKSLYMQSQGRSIRKFCNMSLCPSDYICARYTENHNPNLEYGDFNPQMYGACESFIPVENYKKIVDSKFNSEIKREK